MPYFAALTLVIVLGVGQSARAQDWPQWRGPLGQGTTTARNLPPAAGSALTVMWKTPIPGEGCSSPIVCQGRVYLTAAYEGAERHVWERTASWAIVVLALCLAGLALGQIPSTLRLLTPRPGLMMPLAFWTLAAISLTTVVLAKPPWFWQFPDSWTGTTLAAAQLSWVESLRLRPVIVLACGSLVLIFTGLATGRGEGKQPRKEAILHSSFFILNSSLSSAPTENEELKMKNEELRTNEELGMSSSVLTCWLRFLTLSVTLACGIALGLAAWRPDWFFQGNQPWLAWLVTGGLGLFAWAGSIGWLGERAWLRLLLAGGGMILAGVLFEFTPNDEFGNPLSLFNRIVYLVPAAVLFAAQAIAFVLCPRHGSASPRRPFTVSPILAFTLAALGVIVFVRSNYLQPRTGVVRGVFCLDAGTGAVLWNTPVFVAPAEKRHSLNSQATPTPACDGKRVYAYFGSGLAALDMTGRVLWLKRDPHFGDFIRYGAGSSVVLAGDRIIVFRDSEFMGHSDDINDDVKSQTNRRPTALTAYDKSTGAELWSIAPEFSHDSYMTPLVWTRDGQTEVVVATWKTLAGFAAADGCLRWKHSYPMQQIVPSLAVNDDCLFVTGGNAMPAPMMAVRAPSAQGPARTIWSNRVTGSGIVSPVCWDGRLFSMSDKGVLTCRDAESGRIHWSERLHGQFLASLVAGDGKLYALDQEGTLHVLAAGKTYALLASLSLDENCPATPALADGALFVRTAGHLYRIGSGE